MEILMCSLLQAAASDKSKILVPDKVNVHWPCCCSATASMPGDKQLAPARVQMFPQQRKTTHPLLFVFSQYLAYCQFSVTTELAAGNLDVLLYGNLKEEMNVSYNLWQSLCQFTVWKLISLPVKHGTKRKIIWHKKDMLQFKRKSAVWRNNMSPCDKEL